MIKHFSCFYGIVIYLLTGCNPDISDAYPKESWSTYVLGSGWQFRYNGRWLKAEIPGVVHLDLLRHGLIPDPFAGNNEAILQWIGDSTWIYRLNFDTDTVWQYHDRVEVVFEGIDTYALITLNGTQLGKTGNMFRSYRFDIKPLLRPHNNLLEVALLPAYTEGLKRLQKSRYTLVADNDRGQFKTSVFTRKAPFHYGWDWAPRFITAGIWKPVRIEAWSETRMSQIQFITTRLTASRAQITARATIESLRESKATITIRDDSRSVLRAKKIILKPGKHTYDVDFAITQPKLWWPNGMGEQHLYTLETTLAVSGGSQCHSDNIGLRTVELVQEPDALGSSFMFRVNGMPVFMKGANIIPSDVFLPRVEPEKVEKLVGMARDANMNMLRVWGGGIYPDKAFYEACDRMGILVWQDFIFACSFYPWDDDFLADVSEEATGQVRRLRNHPSLALWCGNNEISEAWHHWGYQKAYGWSAEDSAAIWQGYLRLFEHTLPGVLMQEDPGRPYWPSSPKHGWGSPLSLTRGDSHYWGVWWGEEPFEMYEKKIPRFASEYGFQSFPAATTLGTYVTPSEWKLTSSQVQNHQKHPRGFELIDLYLERQLPMPRRFDDYFYLSQVLQAEGIGRAIEAHRRHMPYCMGSLYWQLNDCWPVVSWSSIDYLLQPKALYHRAARSFAPRLLSFSKDGDTLRCHGITDQGYTVNDTLTLTLFDLRGYMLWSRSARVSVKSGESKELAWVHIGQLLGQSKPEQVVLEARIGDLTARYWFVPDKALQLSDPAIRYEMDRNENVTWLTLRCEAVARHVWIEGIDELLPAGSNFFDLVPGKPLHILMKNPVPADLQSLKIRSLHDYLR